MTSSTSSTRKLAIERRRAQSVTGKTQSAKPISGSAGAPSRAPQSRPVAPVATSGGNAREASIKRRQTLSVRGKAGSTSTDRVRTAESVRVSQPEAVKTDCGCGCGGEKAKASVQATAPAAPKRATSKKQFKPVIDLNSTRAKALMRRKSQSMHGKSASSGEITSAQSARAMNPTLSSRDLAKALREQRAKSGGSGQKAKSSSARRTRPARPVPEESLKVGVSETVSGQVVTGTMVSRDEDVTGNEASTCRAITGTEYMAADVFRDFCGTDAPKSTSSRSEVTSTIAGNRVSGNKIGRAEKVTGNESGTCKTVTGIEYVGSEQDLSFCGSSSTKKPLTENSKPNPTKKGFTVTGEEFGSNAKVTGGEAGSGKQLTGNQYAGGGSESIPSKVGKDTTLRGGSMTGTMVGRSSKVTGDESGSCRNVTGDDYVGRNHFDGFCETAPKPADSKVGMSTSMNGKTVTGTMTGRGSQVTGAEPGTCKAISGTPYAGMEDVQAFCEPEDADSAQRRTRRPGALGNVDTTGIRPGVGGIMTGDERGACSAPTGTPYTSKGDVAAACPAVAAAPQDADFPQPLTQPLTDSTVAATAPTRGGAVTGTSYEGGKITGPFGMATGRVTGTEEFRFGSHGEAALQDVAIVPEEAPEPVARVTGEGMSLKNRITGDDWDRNDRVTGTEGKSVMRNPTRRGGAMNTVMETVASRPETEMSMSRVTGSSGNTDKGAYITYSGGARG